MARNRRRRPLPPPQLPPRAPPPPGLLTPAAGCGFAEAAEGDALGSSAETPQTALDLVLTCLREALLECRPTRPAKSEHVKDMQALRIRLNAERTAESSKPTLRVPKPPKVPMTPSKTTPSKAATNDKAVAK